MSVVCVRGCTLGEGAPKIIVPIVNTTAESIVAQVAEFEGHKLDIVEWRADWYEDIYDIPATLKTLKLLRAALPDKVLLFTFRSANEGGEKPIEPDYYVELCGAVSASGDADLVDVEAFSEKAQETMDAVHAGSALVVGSNHDFDKTPPKDEIVRRLCRMQEMGADIPKIAVMAKSARDVLVMLDATDEMYTEHADRPFLTMSMSGTGSISRMAGEVFGSCATFGSVGKGSAPGQVTVDDLAEVLRVVHIAVS